MENLPLHENIFDIQTYTSGPMGSLTLQIDFLGGYPSGHIFG